MGAVPAAPRRSPLTLFIVALVLASATPLTAQAPVAAAPPLDAAVDFTITLKDLDRLIRQGRFAPPERALVLDGTIKRIDILDPTPETFAVQIELVKGEWFEREAVRSYRSIILLEGSRFVANFPPRGVEATAAAIPLNSRVVVAGMALGVAQLTEDPDDLAWVIAGQHIRAL